MNDLTPFSGDQCNCAKCGSRHVNTQLQTDPTTQKEHLARTCKICGFSWNEATRANSARVLHG